MQLDPLPVPAVKDNPTASFALQKVEELNRKAERRWQGKLILEPALSRSLVSFQANKGRAVYRWFKYKEAFSAKMVEYSGATALSRRLSLAVGSKDERIK